MGVRIISDSASDISQELAGEWKIDILPLHILFGEEEFLDGVTLSHTRFYEKLIETDVCPKTSQIPPFEYSSCFEKAAEAGDDVVCLTLSSGVSGCFQSASLAAEETMKKCGNKIYVVDTKQFCISQFILIEAAVRLRDKGFSAEKIAQTIEAVRSRAHVISVFNTLEYLKLGGRISSAAAAVGGLLSIKPVLTITDGQVDVIGKARGSRQGNNLLNEFIAKTGIDLDLPFVFAYSGFSDRVLKKYISDCAATYGLTDTDSVRIASVGAAIGTYSGPDAFAFAYFDSETSIAQ